MVAADFSLGNAHLAAAVRAEAIQAATPSLGFMVLRWMEQQIGKMPLRGHVGGYLGGSVQLNM